MNLDMSQGAVLLPRTVLTSNIWHKPHWYVKAYLYLYLKASHKPFRGCEKGEVFLPNGYTTLIEALTLMRGFTKKKLSKMDMSRCMSYMMNDTLIDTRKSTRGLYVKILGYEEMQAFENYESDDDRYHEGNMSDTMIVSTVVHTLTYTYIHYILNTPLPPQGENGGDDDKPKFHSVDIGKSKPIKISDENLQVLIQVEDYYKELYGHSPGSRKQYIKNFLHWVDTYELRDFKNAIYRAFHKAKWDWLNLVHLFRTAKDHQPVDYIHTLLFWSEDRAQATPKSFRQQDIEDASKQAWQARENLRKLDQQIAEAEANGTKMILNSYDFL